MEKIVEKILSARRKFPKKFSYADKVVKSLGDKEIYVSKQQVYKIGSGMKPIASFNESDIAIAEAIIELSKAFEAKKKSLLAEDMQLNPSFLKRKQRVVYSDDESVTS